MFPLAIPILSGIAGAVAGGQPNTSSQSFGVQTAPESAWEKRVAGSQANQFGQLESLIGLGPGAQDVTAALGSQRDLASMLSAFSKGGFMPGEAEFAQARQFGGQVFAPQEVALRQSMEEARTQAGRQAALMGRGGADPILQAKLAQQQMQGQERLSAQRGAYEAQFALGLPQQRLDYASQLAQVRGGLATQAMQNRQTLLGLGNQLRQQERDWRLQTATRTQSTSSGGGLAGAISGAMSGFGGGLSLGRSFGADYSSIFGGAKPTGATPTAAQPIQAPAPTPMAAPLPLSNLSQYLAPNGTPGVQGYDANPFSMNNLMQVPQPYPVTPMARPTGMQYRNY